MGRTSSRLSFPIRLAGLVALGLLGGGCQNAHPISNYRLIEHQAMVDFSGLDSTGTQAPLQVVCAIPRNWEALPLQSTPLYDHQQWRAPSTSTGVGVAYVHLPLPLSTDMVIWLAKEKYSQRSDDGHLIAEWTDGLGRHWIEAENRKYHVRGYAMTEGCSAWFVYFGYKINRPMHPGEIAMAAKSLETVVPILSDQAPLVQRPAVADGTR